MAILKQYTKFFHKPLVRYLLVGGISYLLEMGFLALFHRTLGLSALWSVALSFWIGFIISFTLQKIVTFKNYEKHAKALQKQISYYTILLIFNYLFTLTAVKLATPRFSVFLVRTMAIVMTTIWNFYLYKTHIFKAGEAPVY